MYMMVAHRLKKGLKFFLFSYIFIGDFMKKILFCLLILFFPIIVHAISAESYVVMDYDSGRVLLGKNSEKEKLIASTTKIMTAIIAIENGDLNSTRKVGEEVLKAYGSAIYLSLDEEITLKDLLYGLMLRSGNDAAIEIAYHVSGNMEKFVELMNKKAYELGMSNTKFLNNHGLEESDGSGNTSTAYDMAILMRYALKNDTFRSIIGTETYEAKTSGKTYVWQNKNKLLKMYEYNIGGKTGFTKKAKRTLVTASKKEDKTCIVVTLNDGNDFEDHKNLCEKVFEEYERVAILDKESLVIDAQNPQKYYIKNDYYALLTKEEIDQVKIDFKINSEQKEEEVGVAEVYLNDELLTSEKIYQKIEEEKKENFFQKFLRWLFRW